MIYPERKISKTISCLQKLKPLAFWGTLLVLFLTLIASHLRPAYATTIITRTVNNTPVAPIVVSLGDGTVVDTHTGLQWLQNAGLGGMKSWAEADAWATNLSYAGHNDWRLPSALNSDGSLPNPCFYGGCTKSEMGHLAYIDGINSSSGPFSNLGGGYWTSTPPFPDSSYRMYTTFTTVSGNGYQAAIYQQQDGHPPMLMNAWAVRGPLALPVANDDTASTDEGTAVTINVSANDTPLIDLDLASIEIISSTVNGNAIPNLDGTVTYTPTAGFTGDDLFWYLIRDNTNLPSSVATVTVTVNPLYDPAVADFSGSPTSGVAPLTVNFTDLSSGNYDTCAWNFGDGGSSNSCTPPSHTYSTAGVYTVSLTASGLGGSDTQTKASYITVLAPPPVAGFTASPLTGQVPLTVVFTDTSTGAINTWLWDFGDGSPPVPCKTHLTPTP